MEILEVYKIVDTLYPVVNLFSQSNSKRNVKCPFHNDNKASAHIYADGLYCFTCAKTFRATQIAREFNILPLTLYNELLESYGGEDRLLEEYEIKKDILPDLEVSVKPHFENENISQFIRNFFEDDEEQENGNGEIGSKESS
jgi:hypothetical protein